MTTIEALGLSVSPDPRRLRTDADALYGTRARYTIELNAIKEDWQRWLHTQTPSEAAAQCPGCLALASKASSRARFERPMAAATPG
jgi:hypothetical protein